MGSRKGMRAQEQQAREDRELSGAGAGYRDVEEVRTAEEDLIFSLPKELRQDASGKRDSRALGGRGRA